MRNTLEISGVLLAVLQASMAFHAWLTAHDNRLPLQATIATQKQALDAAEVRERDRALTLKDTLAQIEAVKRQTHTPAPILEQLRKFLTLAQPITVTPTRSAVSATQQGTVQQGTAQPEKSACAGKKGCTQPPPPSATSSASEGSPGLESPAGPPRRQTSKISATLPPHKFPPPI
jgi:hypothetical protein